MGDPAALHTEPGGPAVTYGGAPVVQACDLISPDDLRAAGLTMLPGTSPGIVERRYFDGQGTAPITAYSPDLYDGDNTCYYILDIAPDRGSVNVQVHQPGYVPTGEITDARSSRYDNSADLSPDLTAALGDIEVYEPTRPRTDTSYTSRWIHHPDGVDVEIIASSVEPDQFTTLLTTIVTRLPALIAAPIGPPRFTYDSPIYPVDYVNACTIGTAADFHTLFGTTPGPSVTEQLSTGIGRLDFGGDVEANYVDHVCQRRSSNDLYDRNALTIRTTTFDTLDTAAAQFAFTHDFHAGTATPTPIADGSWIGFYLGESAVVFRSGLTIVAVSFRPATITPRTDELLPIAADIATRIPGTN